MQHILQQQQLFLHVSKRTWALSSLTASSLTLLPRAVQGVAEMATIMAVSATPGSTAVEWRYHSTTDAAHAMASASAACSWTTYTVRGCERTYSYGESRHTLNRQVDHNTHLQHPQPMAHCHQLITGQGLTGRLENFMAECGRVWIRIAEPNRTALSKFHRGRSTPKTQRTISKKGGLDKTQQIQCIVHANSKYSAQN